MATRYSYRGIGLLGKLLHNLLLLFVSSKFQMLAIINVHDCILDRHAPAIFAINVGSYVED